MRPLAFHRLGLMVSSPFIIGTRSGVVRPGEKNGGRNLAQANGTRKRAKGPAQDRQPAIPCQGRRVQACCVVTLGPGPRIAAAGAEEKSDGLGVGWVLVALIDVRQDAGVEGRLQSPVLTVPAGVTRGE